MKALTIPQGAEQAHVKHIIERYTYSPWILEKLQKIYQGEVLSKKELSESIMAQWQEPLFEPEPSRKSENESAPALSPKIHEQFQQMEENEQRRRREEWLATLEQLDDQFAAIVGSEMTKETWNNLAQYLDEHTFMDEKTWELTEDFVRTMPDELRTLPGSWANDFIEQPEKRTIRLVRALHVQCPLKDSLSQEQWDTHQRSHRKEPLSTYFPSENDLPNEIRLFTRLIRSDAMKRIRVLSIQEGSNELIPLLVDSNAYPIILRLGDFSFTSQSHELDDMKNLSRVEVLDITAVDSTSTDTLLGFFTTNIAKNLRDFDIGNIEAGKQPIMRMIELKKFRKLEHFTGNAVDNRGRMFRWSIDDDVLRAVTDAKKNGELHSLSTFTIRRTNPQNENTIHYRTAKELENTGVQVELEGVFSTTENNERDRQNENRLIESLMKHQEEKK